MAPEREGRAISAVALLAAAGRGTRLGGETPKAFVALAGRPLLAHAAGAVEATPEITAFVVAVPAGWEEPARETLRSSPKLVTVVVGGPTRQASVRAALAAAPPGLERVVCHDVARPLAPASLFAAVLAALEEADGAVPAVPASDTVKRVRGREVAETLPREELVLVQTPQAFRRGPLEEAHGKAAAGDLVATDDAALLERYGFTVVTVPGDPANLKITGPADLRVAEALLDRG